MLIAITREVSPSIGQCELTHLDRHAIDVDEAISQHQAYENCLAKLGCSVKQVPADRDLPDSVFVEDTAIVLTDLAIITRPGAESRRAETSAVAEVLGRYRPLKMITSPGTIDGGDVLIVGKTIYVGLSRRTNKQGVQQVYDLLGPRGYEVVAIPVRNCLHLKSGVGKVSPETLLINREWVSVDHFKGLQLIDVDPEEPRAAGALLIENTVVYPAMHTRTLKRLHQVGIRTKSVDLSELAKAEAGVTCSSIIFSA